MLLVAHVDWRTTGSLHIKYKNIHVCFLFLFLFSFSRPSASLCEYFVLTNFTDRCIFMLLFLLWVSFAVHICVKDTIKSMIF